MRDMVIVSADMEPETEDGIYIREIDRYPARECTIIRVGPDAPKELKAGQHVLLEGYLHTTTDTGFRLVKAEKILAFVDDDSQA